MTLEFTAPVRIESEMNRREHHMARYRRFAQQRMATHYAFAAVTNGKRPKIGDGLRITLTRIAPRRMDGDNLQGGFKAVRDMIAVDLWVDDGDARLTWLYEQRKGAPREYAISVRIEE